jgi:glucosamine--fructose-6-phosphate aminotransferase (isomerizing)
MTDLGIGMQADIAEQPRAAVAAVEAADDVLARLRPPRGVVLFGRGTSEHAALYGKYLLETRAALPAMIGSPSVATLYGAELDLEGWLVIGVSQSGETREIARCLSWASARGATTAAVTNAPESLLGREADVAIALGAGPERAVAATKTFTAQCVALAALADGWAGARTPWRVLFDALDVATQLTPSTDVVDALSEAGLMVALARGRYVPIAMELALKAMEGCGIWSTGGSWADLLHGPITALPSAATVMTVRGDDHADDPTGRLRNAGHHVVRIGGVRMPDGLDHLQPIVDVIGCQLAVLHAARERGTDPDRPSGLTKVTQT